MENNSMHQDLIEYGGEESDYYLQGEEQDDSNFLYFLNTILSGTARLNILLPTVTVLSFTIFTPLLTDDGQCTALDRWLTAFFLSLSAISCVFFSLTDSFRTAKGRLYYGIATINGIWTFSGGRIKPFIPRDYRLIWADLFHATLSLIAFFTFAASHLDVLSCFHLELPRKATNTIPLVVGFVISVLFVAFPSRRRGIGYPFLLQNDALYCGS